MGNQEKRISREEAEKRILLGLEDIWSDYKKYNPAGKSLTIGILEDEEGNNNFGIVDNSHNILRIYSKYNI